MHPEVLIFFSLPIEPDYLIFDVAVRVLPVLRTTSLCYLPSQRRYTLIQESSYFSQNPWQISQLKSVPFGTYPHKTWSMEPSKNKSTNATLPLKAHFKNQAKMPRFQ